MQSTPLTPRPKRRARWICRAAVALALLYAALAILPCAFPPRETLEADWLLQASSDENQDVAAILSTGDEALSARLRLIAGAKDTIRVGSYLYAMDESGRIITAALLAAADRGVHVRIILDGLIGGINLGLQPEAYALGSHENVEIRLYNPVNLLDPMGLNARYHEKFFVVDDEWLILGGRNVSDEFLTPETHEKYNYDQDVLLHHTGTGRGGAAQVAEYFDNMWDSGLCGAAYDEAPALLGERTRQARDDFRRAWEDIAGTRDLSPVDDSAFAPVEKTVLITGSTAPRTKASGVYDRLIDLMKAARERVILQTPYLVMDGAMRDKISSVCALSSDVTILTNSVGSGNNVVASADGVFHRGDAAALDARVLEFQGDRSMHTKSILIDGNISVFGSFNMDARSAYLDTELMLAVYSPEVAAELEGVMGSLIARSAPVNDAAAAVFPEGARKEAALGKRIAITLLSPFASLFRFLV